MLLNKLLKESQIYDDELTHIHIFQVKVVDGGKDILVEAIQDQETVVFNDWDGVGVIRQNKTLLGQLKLGTKIIIALGVNDSNL